MAGRFPHTTISVGPTVRIFRYTASRPPYGRPVPPHYYQCRAHRPHFSVHRFAASLWPAGSPTLLTRLLLQLSIDYFFDKFHASKFENLCVLFLAAVERHAHLPRPRKHLRILDRHFVIQMVRTCGGEPFNDM